MNSWTLATWAAVSLPLASLAATKGNVFSDRATKQDVILENQTNLTAQTGLSHAANINAIHFDSTISHIVESS